MSRFVLVLVIAALLVTSSKAQTSSDIPWMRKAAEQGDGLIQYMLGMMCLRGGKGVPQDYAKALTHYYLPPSWVHWTHTLP